jgi:hypothetical protein
VVTARAPEKDRPAFLLAKISESSYLGNFMIGAALYRSDLKLATGRYTGGGGFFFVQGRAME